LNIKDIQQRTRLDYAYCHKRVKLLQRLNFIEQRGSKQGPKGHDLRLYDLALAGLMVYLNFTEYEKIDNVAEKYKYLLPHVFGEWQYFRESNTMSVILDNLKTTFNIYMTLVFSVKYVPDQPSTFFPNLGDNVEEQILAPWIVRMEKYWSEEYHSPELQKAVRRNPRIWHYLNPKVLHLKEQVEKVYSEYKGFLKELDGSA
jgi:hypothetical protein